MDTEKIIIEIENLTKPQRKAIEDFLFMWNFLGKAGMSRWTAFYADGDGNFNPNIKINGENPKHLDPPIQDENWKEFTIKSEDYFYSNDIYLVDFDSVNYQI